MDNGFGLAQLKVEGGEIPYDAHEPSKPCDELDSAYIDRDYEFWYADCLACGIEPTLDQLRLAEKHFMEGW